MLDQIVYVVDPIEYCIFLEGVVSSYNSVSDCGFIKSPIKAIERNVGGAELC